jgi:hypothetical protein
MGQLIVSGDATAADVLIGHTFSAGPLNGVAGTMPDNGAGGTVTPSASTQTKAAGYYSSAITISAVTFTAANVLTGTTIAGTAGTMPNRGAVTITPSSAAQTIAAGYHNGSGTVAAVTVPAANVLTGTTIAGVAGTMVNNGAGGTVTPSASTQTKPAGYYSSAITISAVSVPAANVLTGTTIAGTAGTMPNRGAVTITPSASAQTIAAGYHNGSGSVAAVTFPTEYVLNGVVIAGTEGTMASYGDQEMITAGGTMGEGYVTLSSYAEGYVNSGTTYSLQSGVISASKILAGQNILGLGGTATSDATAVAADVLSGKTVYINGAKIIGTMPNITSGSDPAQGVGLWGDGGLAVYPSPGYRKGGAGAGEIKVSVAQLQTVASIQPGNIRSGVTLFGVVGNVVPRVYSYYSFSMDAGSNVVGYNAGFTPRAIAVRGTVGQTVVAASWFSDGNVYGSFAQYIAISTAGNNITFTRQTSGTINFDVSIFG